MGVMSCNREGCNNIMCDTYIEGIGYICFDCQAEFKQSLPNTIMLVDIRIIELLLKRFMHTEKGTYCDNDTIINEYFKSKTQ